MKKAKSIIALVLIATILSSCATIFGGPVNAYQRTKPLPGQQQRRLRVDAFIHSRYSFIWPGAVVDFATCAIYRPTPAPAETAPAQPAPASTRQSM